MKPSFLFPFIASAATTVSARSIPPYPLSNSTAASSLGGPSSCNGTASFKDISAHDFVEALNPGWNLGNTLDATPDEGDWGNAPVVAETFGYVKEAGFNSVRIPVTWAYHFKTQARDYTVDPAWLQRVSDVIDMVTDRGLYAIVNVHHDSWIWANLDTPANYSSIEDKFYNLWFQIGTKLACKSELVAFEPLNEPAGSTAEAGAEMNRLNDIFLKAINDAGGFNSKRVVTLVGLGEDAAKTSQWFQRPNGTYSNPWALQYHYYSPYAFIFSAWGKTIWGSDDDKAALETDIGGFRRNFSDIPVLIGEWAASTTNTETAARWKYFDSLVSTAKKYNTSTVLWDNGQDFFDRNANVWRDQSAIDIFMGAAAGVANALADSTTDNQTTTQSSSAYIWQKGNDTVSDQKIPFLFNGNQISRITKGGQALAEGTDFSVDGSSVVFKKSFLSTIFANRAPGIKANLTLEFDSAAAPLTIQAVQWDVPTIGNNTISAKAAGSGEYKIPVTYKGLKKLAAVRALKQDGSILIDDYTQWFGALEKGRMTYSSQWTWDDSHVILENAVAQAVSSAKQPVVLTFEFYPRVPGNSLNVTMTP
ncbi:endoglucanase D precursor [Phyllosticta capitalensis]|uniref:glycoside hydrolase superfamily n=1 Tax=Phyllosticta capitalensis TaxID=121624 RepID=UPI00313036A3